MLTSSSLLLFFFFNDTATTEIYTLSLHDALPISTPPTAGCSTAPCARWRCGDRKSTRLNSSHLVISYAVFCLKKKKNSYYQIFHYGHTHAFQVRHSSNTST